VLADRHSAGREQYVRVETAFERGTHRTRVIGDCSVDHGVGARPLDLRREHHGVRLVDLARTERLAGPAKLATRGEHRNARPPCAANVLETGRGERPELRRPAPRAGGNNGLARRDVTAARTDVLTGSDLFDVH